MTVNALFTLVIIGLTQASPSKSPAASAAAQDQAQRFVDATVKQDYAKIVEMTHPKLLAHWAEDKKHLRGCGRPTKSFRKPA